jgi:vacuolar-type H+-ATPase subunit H
VAHTRTRNPELARILEAETEARLRLERAEGEARRLEEEAQRLADERLAQAQRALVEQREAARQVVLERGEDQVRRLRSEARGERERVVELEARRGDAAVEAALAVLLGEES